MPKTKGRGNGEGSIYLDKSKGRYFGAVTVAVDPVTQRPTARVKVSGRTREEVAQKIAELLVRHNRGELAAPSRLTLGGLLDTWLDWKRDFIKPTTLASWRVQVDRYLKPELGDVEVQKLTRIQVEAAFKRMKQPRPTANARAGAARAAGKTEPPTRTFVPANTTLEIGLMVLKLALKEYAIERLGLIHKNPAEGAKLPKVLTQEGRTRNEPWTAAEAARFFAAAFQHHWFPAFYLAGLHGLREAEIAGLKWPKIRIDPGRLGAKGDGEIVVDWQRTRAGSEIVEYTPKSERGRREFAISPKAVAIFREYRLQQQEWARDFGWAWSPETYLIVNPETGTPVDPKALYRRFAALTEALGLRRVTFHDLRHGYVSLANAAGVPLPVISRKVGHHSVKFTGDVYRHLFKDELVSAAGTLDALVPHVAERLLPIAPEGAGALEGEAVALENRGVSGRKVTPAQVRRIRERVAAGESPERVALDYGVSGRYVRYIAGGERQRRVVGETKPA